MKIKPSKRKFTASVKPKENVKESDAQAFYRLLAKSVVAFFDAHPDIKEQIDRKIAERAGA